MKALIIDDHPVFVAALESLLRHIRRGTSIDTATSAEAALRHIDVHPDYQFILLDLCMPGLDGFAFMRALQQRKLPIPVIIVSSSEEPETIHACINAGAVGFIPKSHDLNQMAQAIERIQDGEIYLPQGVPQRVPQRVSQGMPQGLTPTPAQADAAAIRQRCEQIGIPDKSYQVLLWLAKGKTNKEIAEELYISVHTVKAHLAKLFERLQTSNRMETVTEAIRLELIAG